MVNFKRVLYFIIEDSLNDIDNKIAEFDTQILDLDTQIKASIREQAYASE
jgi:hypothetical protein